MLTLFYVYTFYLLLPLLVLAAMRWGGWPERTVAWLYVAALGGTELVKSRVASFLTLEAGVLVVDATLLAALATIAIRSGRLWVVWATAFHFIGTLGHLGKLVNPNMSPMAYGLMESVSSYPALIVLAIGILAHRRRTIAAVAATSSATC